MRGEHGPGRLEQPAQPGAGHPDRGGAAAEEEALAEHERPHRGADLGGGEVAGGDGDEVPEGAPPRAAGGGSEPGGEVDAVEPVEVAQRPQAEHRPGDGEPVAVAEEGHAHERRAEVERSRQRALAEAGTAPALVDDEHVEPRRQRDEVVGAEAAEQGAMLGAAGEHDVLPAVELAAELPVGVGARHPAEHRPALEEERPPAPVGGGERRGDPGDPPSDDDAVPHRRPVTAPPTTARPATASLVRVSRRSRAGRGAQSRSRSRSSRVR